MMVKAAGLFLVNNENKILIGHPTNHAPNFWSIPKGKTDDGELEHDAAIRETLEETNIDVKDYQILHILPRVNYNHKKKCLYPFVLFEKENPFDFGKFDIKCNSNVSDDRGGFPEMDDFKWVTLDEAKDILHETQVKSLKYVQLLIDSPNNGIDCILKDESNRD